MKAKSIHGLTVPAIKEELEKAMADGFHPGLALVFVSIKLDRKAIGDMLKEKGIELFGVTSCGEFIQNHQTEGGAVLLLLELPGDAYSILFKEIGGRSLQATAADLAADAGKQFDNPSLILCSTGMNRKGEFLDGESLVKHFEQAIGTGRLFFGGMAGDDMTFTGTYVFTHEKETDAGILALVLDGNRIGLSGMAITGWKPMGISRTVTRSQGNRLHEIDGQPAVEMYLRYLGKEEKKADKEFNVFEELGFTYPFITERAAGGEMVLRSPLKIDHGENALVMDIEMREGTRFWFSMPPDFDIVDEILEEAGRLKQTGDADALLIFSCAGRSPVLGPLVTAENNGLAGIWQSPMAGFFTYGEYGRTKLGKQEYHSGACCWVALKEK